MIKNPYRLLLLTLGVAVLAGCATTSELERVPVPTGGSKGDAIVIMSYYEHKGEDPIVHWDVAQERAIKRCRAWGYKKASAFSGETKSCKGAYGYGCATQIISRTYQCYK